MHDRARASGAVSARQIKGRVRAMPVPVEPLRLRDDALVVETGEGDVVARRAVSCLVEPRPADEVLLACFEDGSTFILAVLSRERDDRSVTLSARGSIAIRSGEGSISLCAPEDITVATAGTVGLAAAKVDAAAPRADLAFDALLITSDRTTLAAGVIETVAETLSERFKTARRVVEEVDQLRARFVDVVAKTAYRLHARAAVMTADDLVKVDSEQIHLG